MVIENVKIQQQHMLIIPTFNYSTSFQKQFETPKTLKQQHSASQFDSLEFLLIYADFFEPNDVTSKCQLTLHVYYSRSMQLADSLMSSI